MEIKHCCKLQEGYVNPSQKELNYFGNEIKWLRASDLNNSFVYDTERKLSNEGFKSAGKSALLFKPETLAISKSGTIGQIGILKDFMCGNRAVINIEPNIDKVDLMYLYYWLIINRKLIVKKATGSIQKNLYVSLLGGFDIGNLSVLEQRALTEQINPYTEKMATNNKLINFLEEYSQLFFHKWFVDFNFPNEEGKPYKDSGGEMVEVDGKMIPKGWSINFLNNLIDKSTKSIIPQDSPEATFLYYSIPVYDETHMYSLEKGSAIGSNKYVVDRSNLLVSKLNPWFKRVVYPYKVKEAICSTEYVVFNPKVEGILEYLYVLARTNLFTEHNTRAASGTSNSHKRVSPDHMLRYNIYINIDTIKKFNEIIKPLIEKIFGLYEENQLLEEKRDLLIKKLIK